MARTKRAAEQIAERERSNFDLESDDAVKNLIGVSSGSTMLNLAMTDDPSVAFIVGRFVNIIGDFSSGKSFISLTAFAEACANEFFDDHDLIYDDAEHASGFNIEKLFGKKVAERVKPPRYDDEGGALFSNTVEDFQDNFRDRLESDCPCIYILDSYDALDAEDDIDKSNKQRRQRQAGQEVTGSYGTAKAKKSSEIFRRIKADLMNTNSILIVISQTRADINPMTFTTKTRSGGNALDFYASHLVWTAKVEQMKKKKIPIGVKVRGKVSKNKITGKQGREVDFPIFYSYGVDDIRSCIEWLVQQERFKKVGQKIDAPELKLKCTMDKFIQEIEKGNLEQDLIDIAAEEWHDRESVLDMHRKSKYGD
jgi:RecA/RadA recombinase